MAVRTDKLSDGTTITWNNGDGYTQYDSGGSIISYGGGQIPYGTSIVSSNQPSTSNNSSNNSSNNLTPLQQAVSDAQAGNTQGVIDYLQTQAGTSSPASVIPPVVPPVTPPVTPPTTTPTPSTPTATTAEEIRNAQAAALATMKEGYDNRLAAQLQTYNTERAKIPAQTTVANNETSSRGKINAQQIRNALAQMGLLQSGESATQQLANDISTANNINANNLQGKNLDASYADKTAAAIAQNAVDYINAAYQIGRDTTNDRQWGQTFAQQQIQDAFNNAINATNATGYAPKTIQDLYPGWAGSNTTGGQVSSGKVYGTAGDRILNPSIELYVPGVTQLSPNDTFLGGTAVLPDSALNGAQRIAGYTAQETSDKYNTALANGTVRAKSSTGGSVYYNPN